MLVASGMPQQRLSQGHYRKKTVREVTAPQDTEGSHPGSQLETDKTLYIQSSSHSSKGLTSGRWNSAGCQETTKFHNRGKLSPQGS